MLFHFISGVTITRVFFVEFSLTSDLHSSLTLCGRFVYLLTSQTFDDAFHKYHKTDGVDVTLGAANAVKFKTQQPL